MTLTVESRAQRIAALGYDYRSQPREAVTACNLCGATAFVVVTHRDRYGYPAEAHACETCGLVFINPRMTAEAYGRFYEGVYRPLVSAYHGRLIDADTIQDEQRVYGAACADFLRPFIAGAGLRTMLDIGGSTGVVARVLADEFALQGTVIDPAPPEVARAKAYGLETITGLVEEYDFGDRRFDLIVLCQTVDHLLDVSGTLTRIRELLSDGGFFFVDIEHRPQAGAGNERTQEVRTCGAVSALLALDGVRVDQPPVIGADQWAIHALVEPAVCLRGHARVDEHEPAGFAGVRFRGIPVPIAVRHDDERSSAAEVASGDGVARLRTIVVAEGGNPLRAAFNGQRHVVG